MEGGGKLTAACHRLLSGFVVAMSVLVLGHQLQQLDGWQRAPRMTRSIFRVS